MKDEDQRNSGGSFVTGLLVGALLGAAVAMVLAPASGEETRDLLRAKSREARNLVRDSAVDLGGQASEMYVHGKSVVDGARDSISGAIDEGKQVTQDERNRLLPET